MGLKKSLHPQNKMIFQNSCTSPLGSIRLSGRIQQSLGNDQGRQRRLEAYALVYSLDGKCNYWDEIVGSRQLVPGDLVVLLPGVAHRYGAGPDGHWNEFFIVFDGPVFDVWRESGLLSPLRPVYRLEPVAFWEKRLGDCLGQAESSGRDAAIRQVCGLQSLLGEIIGLSGTESRPGPAWIEKACAMLARSQAENGSLHELARSLGVSFETFRKTFALHVGMSPGRYRSARLMDRACELMAQGRLSGKEIAAKLGFFDEYHFSKRFKQVTGFSPTAFRQRVCGSQLKVPPALVSVGSVSP